MGEPSTRASTEWVAERSGSGCAYRTPKVETDECAHVEGVTPEGNAWLGESSSWLLVEEVVVAGLTLAFSKSSAIWFRTRVASEGNKYPCEYLQKKIGQLTRIAKTDKTYTVPLLG